VDYPPSLLDRLIPPIAGESPAAGRITARRMQQILLRDLTWLLSSTSLSTLVDFGDRTHIARSVLNYGVSDFLSCNKDALDLARVCAGIRRAIQDFEPRLDRDSIVVDLQPVPGEDSAHLLELRIEAVASIPDLGTDIHLRTIVDRGNGQIKLSGAPGTQ
jgi:type VI secretion system protein ImpF